MNISNELLNAILTYLGKRPYNESFQLIDKIRQELNADASQDKPILKEVKK